MGIKGLNKLINQYAETALTQKHISEFCGSRVAIDSEILIHKFRTVDSDNSHIFGFINNIFWHLENGIVPIYVFDGAPNIAKQSNVLVKRFTYKEQMYRKVEELENKFLEQLDDMTNKNFDMTKNFDMSQEDNETRYEHTEHEHTEHEHTEHEHTELSPEINNTLDQLFKIQRKMSFMTVTKNHRNECKYLLKLMGIPFIVANEDAEALCVALQRKNLVDYIYTEDTDAIPYFVARLNEELEKSITSFKILRKGDTLDMVTVIDVKIIFT